MASNREIQQRTEEVAADRTVAPPVDIFENEQALVLVADMPGVVVDQLDVQLNDRELAVVGRRSASRDGEQGAVVYRRTFALANVFDADRVSAKLDAGVLELTLPKSSGVRARQIPVTQG